MWYLVTWHHFLWAHIWPTSMVGQGRKGTVNKHPGQKNKVWPLHINRYQRRDFQDALYHLTKATWLVRAFFCLWNSQKEYSAVKRVYITCYNTSNGPLRNDHDLKITHFISWIQKEVWITWRGPSHIRAENVRNFYWRTVLLTH